MLNKMAYLIALLAVVSMPTLAAEDSSDVATVVAAIKAANPDLKSLCQQGPDGIRKASSAAVMGILSSGGKLKGNPQAVGGEAGQAIGRECRG
jgi:hypothetical protein